MSTATPTHAGGVVFRAADSGPEYLVVEATGGRGDWVLPKGHIEPDDASPEAAAHREVLEEAGVRSETVAPLDRLTFDRGDKTVIVAFFLLLCVGTEPPLEARQQAWLPFDEARARLTFEGSRRVLDQAAGLLSA